MNTTTSPMLLRMAIDSLWIDLESLFQASCGIHKDKKKRRATRLAKLKASADEIRTFARDGIAPLLSDRSGCDGNKYVFRLCRAVRLAERYAAFLANPKNDGQRFSHEPRDYESLDELLTRLKTSSDTLIDVSDVGPRFEKWPKNAGTESTPRSTRWSN
ncbi:MAG: hypothetical protein IIA67_00215 [Planctomycetes bacterium]|nr:hypothetical protein [Planctomycetota bacterium]